jgi:hypothetical protein
VLNRLTDEFAKLQKVAGQISTEDVIQWLKESEQVMTDFQSVVGELPTVKEPTKEEQVLWANERSVLGIKVHALQKALSLYPIGKRFVEETQNRHRPEQAARNMRNAMNPGVLQHNGPVYKAMLSALAAFEKVDSQYGSAKAKVVPVQQAVAYNTRKLELCFQGLRGAIKIAKAQRALQTLKPDSPMPRRARKPSKRTKKAANA